MLRSLIKEELRKRSLIKEFVLLLEKEIKLGNNLRKKLNNINKPFADKLLQFLTSDNIPDRVTFDSLDFTEDDDKTLTAYYIDNNGKIKSRKFKVGKLLNYLGIGTKDFKGYEIEELISYLKKGTLEDFRVVEGNDILWAYHCDNYDEGETMGSCMRYEAAQKYLEIYTQNPNEVKCLVLINPANKKVRGRALLWYMDNGNVYMDRIYTTNKQYNSLFNLYMEENSISYSASSTVTLENGGEYDYYPYMDTFEYYNVEEGVLSSDRDSDSIKLQDQHGGYEEGGVYVDFGRYAGQYLDEDDVYFIEYKYNGKWFSGYVHQDDATYIDDGVYLDEHVIKLYSGGYVFKGSCDECVEITDGEGEGEIDLLENVYELENDYYGYDRYALTSECVQLSKEHYDYAYALRDDVIEDYEGNYIIESDSVELYPEHYGEDMLAYSDITKSVKIKGYGKTHILEEDFDDFEERGLIE
jgi:hypothetical protein